MEKKFFFTNRERERKFIRYQNMVTCLLLDKDPKPHVLFCLKNDREFK